MRRLIGVVLALAMAQSAAAESLKIVIPEPVVMPSLPAGAKVRAVSLTRLAANIPPGAPWVEEQEAPYFMLPCIAGGEIGYWKEANNKIAALETFDRIFRDELKAAGLQASGDPTNLFEEQRSSDLQVGALITGLRVKTCHTATLLKSLWGGSATMDVEWQIYSVSQAKVLARITTNGGFVLPPKDDSSLAPLLGGVFADNVRRLAAEDRFRQIVTADDRPVSLPPPPRISLPTAVGKMPLNVAANGVVSIFAGDGLGSGVLIAPGYILTNHHVAGEAGQVRIRWPNGSDTVGEVIRADRRRDVALIKTASPKGVSPLAIRHSPVQLGETVYAIGTPREREFAGTLTRGVISTVSREIEGLRYIQSDVAITHGNSGGPLLDEKGWVVGIAQSVYEPDGVSQNINFFIPIDEALKALALGPVG